MSVMHKVEVLRAACCVAGIDGDTTKAEHEMLEKLARQIGVGHASLQAMVDRAEKDPKFYDEQFLLLKTKPDTTMRILLSIAMADRDLDDNECVVLKAFAGRLGLAEDKFARVLEKAKGRLEDK